MQRPDEAKRQAITDAAAALFAQRPFHEVRLDDVAEAAHVGKGTLYVYFKSKEDLYGSLVVEGFSELIDSLRGHAESGRGSAWEALERIVRDLVAWAKRFPHVFELMRSGREFGARPELRAKRRELTKLIEATIRRGVRDGEFIDPRPDLTSQFIPSCVRGALRFGPADIGQAALSSHILRMIGGGILRRKR